MEIRRHSRLTCINVDSSSVQSDYLMILVARKGLCSEYRCWGDELPEALFEMNGKSYRVMVEEVDGLRP